MCVVRLLPLAVFTLITTFVYLFGAFGDESHHAEGVGREAVHEGLWRKEPARLLGLDFSRANVDLHGARYFGDASANPLAVAHDLARAALAFPTIV